MRVSRACIFLSGEEQGPPCVYQDVYFYMGRGLLQGGPPCVNLGGVLLPKEGKWASPYGRELLPGAGRGGAGRGGAPMCVSRACTFTGGGWGQASP